MMSPTARTLDQCRRNGWTVAVAESFNFLTKTRRDLFGFIDVVALTEEGFLGIQATTGDNAAARVTKIKTTRRQAAMKWIECGGRIEVWGWTKYKNKVDRRSWRPRIVEVTFDDLR